MRNKMMLVAVAGTLMLAGCGSKTESTQLSGIAQDVQSIQQGQQANSAKIDRLAADVAEAKASADRANSRLDQMGRYTK